MEYLPHQIKINIMNYIPRRIHPCSTLIKQLLVKHSWNRKDKIIVCDCRRDCLGDLLKHKRKTHYYKKNDVLMCNWSDRSKDDIFSDSEDDEDEDEDYSESEHLNTDENE